MSDNRESARRIVEAVVRASPPPEIQKPGYLDEHLAPLRDLLAHVSDGLKVARAKASVSAPVFKEVIPPGLIVEYDYRLVSNSGNPALLAIKGILQNPGAIPKFAILGMDDTATSAMRDLAGSDGWNAIYGHMASGVAELEGFLLRFLPS